MELNEFLKVIKNNNLTLVDFYAEWCGPCKILSPIIDKVKEKIGDKINVIKIDVDKNEFISFYYEIKSVPTLILFKNDIIIWRNTGVLSEEKIIDVISKYL